jgi:hypothetical protein
MSDFELDLAFNGLRDAFEILSLKSDIDTLATEVRRLREVVSHASYKHSDMSLAQNVISPSDETSISKILEALE